MAWMARSAYEPHGFSEERSSFVAEGFGEMVVLSRRTRPQLALAAFDPCHSTNSGSLSPRGRGRCRLAATRWSKGKRCDLCMVVFSFEGRQINLTAGAVAREGFGQIG